MTRRSRTLLLLVAILFMSPAVQAQEEELASPELRISWSDFKKLYDARGLVLVDVRSSDSFVTFLAREPSRCRTSKRRSPSSGG